MSQTPPPGACKANVSDPVPSLLLCGVAAVVLQHYEEAEIFFEDACCLEPSSIIAWTLSGTKASQPMCSRCSCRDKHCFCPCSSSSCSNLRAKGRIFLRVGCLLTLLFLSPIGLFYELQDNNIQAEMAFREAKKLLQAQLAKERSIPEAAEGEGGEKQASAVCVRSPSPGPEECLPGNAEQNQEVP